jgi:Protein of unknown function (DUF2630)
MEDVDIVRRIGELSDEEHKLRSSHGRTRLSETETERLHHLEVALDQCWDLLRQRRAHREFGQDPDNSSVRSEATVESYKQ